MIEITHDPWTYRMIPLNADEIPADVAEEIARQVDGKQIWWSDDKYVHWMFDFYCCGWWVCASMIDMCGNVMELHCEYALRD